MLKKIKIKNIALINEATIEFENGLNVLTGETGAGKSLIIDSLNFLMGIRADKSIIKNGESFARVDGTFSINNNSYIIKELDNLGIECEDIIIISRLFNSNGKNECMINGEIVPLGILKKISSYLIDIFGQFDHQILLDTKKHLILVDSYGISTITPLKEELAEQISILKDLELQIKSFGGDDESRIKQIDLLNYQINEIEKSNLLIDEDSSLLETKNIMLNSEKIISSLSEIEDILSGNVDIVNNLKNASNLINSIERYDNAFVELKSKLDTIRFDLIDVNESVNKYLSNCEYDEQELNKIEERLDLIFELKRKYGNTILDIIEYGNKAKSKLYLLENSTDEINKLKLQKQKILSKIYVCCTNISNERKKVCKSFENSIVLELQELGILHPKFEVCFKNNNYNENNFEYNDDGFDDVEFLFSANLGEDVKPLNKIISGGEMSRFMLAFKCVVNAKNQHMTYVFDEIDAGIGGNIGLAVGKKLVKISLFDQLIVVTHLAQIASFADNNISINKVEVDNKTISFATILDDDGKIKEITRMLGSTNNLDYSILHAKQLINDCDVYKNDLIKKSNI